MKRFHMGALRSKDLKIKFEKKTIREGLQAECKIEKKSYLKDKINSKSKSKSKSKRVY